MIVASEDVDHRRGIDYIGVGICCVVHDGNGNILMMKRGEHARDEQGKWDIVGGAIEFSEYIDEAVRREIMEEICVEPFNVQFVKAYEAHRIHNGAPTHWIQLFHTVQVDPDKVKNGEPLKIAELGWFNKSNLPEPRHSQFHQAFEAIEGLGIIG